MVVAHGGGSVIAEKRAANNNARALLRPLFPLIFFFVHKQSELRFRRGFREINCHSFAAYEYNGSILAALKMRFHVDRGRTAMWIELLPD